MLRLLTLLFFFLYSSLQAEVFIINDYKVKMFVANNGQVTIQEDITLNFSESRRGIIRRIPHTYKFNGKKVGLKIASVKVDGWNYKSYSRDGYFHIRFGDEDIFLTGQQSYSYEYTVEGAIFDSESYQEIYWDILGSDWQTTTENFSYEIHFPSNLELGFNDYQIYSGKYGQVQSKVSMNYNNSILTGESNAKLLENESVTVAVKFPASYFAVSNNSSNYEAVNDKTWPAAVLAIFSLFGFWWRNGKNNKIEASDYDVFYPPKDMSPSELGLLIDNYANDEDLLANIPHWANQELIKIITIDTAGEEGMVIEKLRDIPHHKADYEKTLFEGIFKEGNFVSLKSLKKKIYKELHQSKSRLAKDMRSTDYYQDKQDSYFRDYKMIILFFLLLGTGILTIVMMKTVITGVLLILTAVLALILRLLPPKRSHRGDELIAEIKSFKNFLSNHDHPEYLNLLKKDPEYLTKMYPYAIAFGINKKYTDKFESYEVESPHWYYIGNDSVQQRGSMSQFQDNFEVESIKSAFRSMPSSSSSGSGSFSGGGFSGGGAGGGGGSSW